jgi:hypothetical protein
MFLSMGEESGMESAFWFGFGIVTGMAALPWFQRLADRVRRTLADLELYEPAIPRATAPDDEWHSS